MNILIFMLFCCLGLIEAQIHTETPQVSSTNTNSQFSPLSSTPSSFNSSNNNANFLSFPPSIPVSDHTDQTHPSQLITITNKPNFTELIIITIASTRSILTSQEGAFVYEIGAEYGITAVMQIPRWIDIGAPSFITELQTRLRNVVSAAVERQQAKRYGLAGNQNVQQQNSGFDEKDFSVQILNISRQERNNNIQTLFITRYKQGPMPAATLIEDLRLLSSAEQSAIAGYPVVEMKTYLPGEETEKRNLWIIGAVIGSVLGVLLCGWCILFAYYNTCGRVFRYSDSVEEDRRRKTKILHDSNVMTGTTGQHEALEKGHREISRITHEPLADENDRDGKVEKIYLVSEHVQTDFGNGDLEINRDGKSHKNNDNIQTVADGRLNHSAGRTPVHGQESLKNGTGKGPQMIYAGKKITKSATRPELFSPGSSSIGAGSSAIQQMDNTTDMTSSIGHLTFTNSHAISPASGMKQLTATSDAAQTPSQAVQLQGDSKPSDTITIPISPSNLQNLPDMWSVYPWRPYQAGDQAHMLTQSLADHPSPYQTTSGPDGTIVMHSKLLTAGTTIAKNDRRFDMNPLYSLI